MAESAYTYTGRDGSGKLVKGRLEAPTQGAAVSKIRALGVAPISVEESAAGTGLQMEIKLPGSGKTRVKLKDLAVMARQMATMIGAGLSLIRTLGILADQTENKELGRLLTVIRSDVEQGSALSEAFAKHEAFPPLMVHMIRAGEIGGFLDKALVGTADNFEADVKLRDTIKSALTYPVIVLIISIVAVIGMIIFIVPVFKGMFAGFDAELPLPTQFLVVLSENMVWILPVLIVATVAFAAWWRVNKYKDAVRSRLDKIRLKLPIFGDLYQKIAIARFTRTFSTMLGAGVPILQALAIVGETSGSWSIEQALRKVQESVRQGRSVSGPMADEPIFPSMVTQMVAVGEDSGSMETMLDKVGAFYEAEVESTTKALTSLIEPLMIVVLGIIIGGMIVALYLPVFTIYNEI